MDTSSSRRRRIKSHARESHVFYCLTWQNRSVSVVASMAVESVPRAATCAEHHSPVRLVAVRSVFHTVSLRTFRCMRRSSAETSVSCGVTVISVVWNASRSHSNNASVPAAERELRRVRNVLPQGREIDCKELVVYATSACSACSARVWQRAPHVADGRTRYCVWPAACHRRRFVNAVTIVCRLYEFD